MVSQERDALQALMQAAADRTQRVRTSAPIVEELTPDESRELMELALANTRAMTRRAVRRRQESEQDRYVASVDPAEEEKPVEDCPQTEKVVEVPDYTNIREETTRFSDADWFKTIQNQTVVLAGVGGIGSNMAIILAKLNPKSLYLFDGDTVETVNLAGQFYSKDDIGKYKVDAIAESIIKYTNYSSVFACPRNYVEGEEIASKVMVCGFDNMYARKTYYKIWKTLVESLPESERKEALFIDGRLTADEFQIFCMTGEDDYYMREYENKWLFTQAEAERTRCSFKQTGYLADMIGAFMVNLLVNFCANLSNPLRNMPLPFITSYKADAMYFNMVK